LEIPTTASQDEFIKICEKTFTEVDRESNKISVGWYSPSDMKTALKWSQILEQTSYTSVDLTHTWKMSETYCFSNVFFWFVRLFNIG
jgi:alpha-L-arabinofuranosidase